MRKNRTIAINPKFIQSIILDESKISIHVDNITFSQNYPSSQEAQKAYEKFKKQLCGVPIILYQEYEDGR